MNGSKGRARTIATIQRRRKAEAAASGIDPKDRRAVDEFHLRQIEDIGARIVKDSQCKSTS